MRSVLLILDESLCADAIPSSLKSLAETPVIASSIEEAQRLLDASFFSLVLAPAALLGELSAPETSMRLGLARSEAEAIACLEAGAAGSLSLPISAPLLEAYLRRAELRRDELLLARAHRIAFEEATDAMEIADAQTRILRVNRAFERSTGYSSEEALGQTPGALMRSRAHDPSFYDDIEARLGRGESWSGALVGRRKDGTLVHQAARILGVMDDAAELALQVAIKEHLTFAAPRGLPPRSPADESDTPASLRML
ncbi:MAG: PAS domain S-box protein, partial [Myxococcales bacterium]|nr:PAS domain S-box protein [Myxococcales bacterium]